MRVIIQEEALRRSEGHYYHHFIQELPTIDAVPVVDAVEVVRCKDCEHRHTVHCPMVYEDLDYTGTFVIVRDNSFNDDGFCHRGTPKKGESSK